MGESVTHSVRLPDAAATESLGRQLVAALPASPAGWTVLLQGDLGAGKSTLARAMLRALGHTGPVPSPTYTLVEPYEFPAFVAYHIDLYRINAEEELDPLGWDELRDGLVLIEWPERVAGLAATTDLEVSLSLDGSGRRAEIRGRSERGAACLRRLFGT